MEKFIFDQLTWMRCHYFNCEITHWHVKRFNKLRFKKKVNYKRKEKRRTRKKPTSISKLLLVPEFLIEVFVPIIHLFITWSYWDVCAIAFNYLLSCVISPSLITWFLDYRMVYFIVYCLYSISAFLEDLHVFFGITRAYFILFFQCY